MVSAIGEEAVANAVLAACRSRIYLEDDQLDIKFVAIKETIRKTGGDGITKLLPSIELHIQIDEVR